MRKIFAALILAVLISGVSYSVEPKKYEPIPSEKFKPYQIDKIIYDPIIPTPVPTIVERKQPISSPIIVPVIRAPSKPVNNSLTGVASWYCHLPVSRCTVGHSSGYYAAIRKDLLELRGKQVLVCTSSRCLKVTIIDCNCGSNANLIDLYWDAFNYLSDPSLGRMKVTIKW